MRTACEAPSVIRSIKTQINNSISNHLDYLSDEMQNYDMYKDNYNYIIKLPIVKRIIAENTLLKNKIKDLKNIIGVLKFILDSNKNNEKPSTKKRQKLRKPLEPTVPLTSGAIIEAGFVQGSAAPVASGVPLNDAFSTGVVAYVNESTNDTNVKENIVVPFKIDCFNSPCEFEYLNNKKQVA